MCRSCVGDGWKGMTTRRRCCIFSKKSRCASARCHGSSSLSDNFAGSSPPDFAVFPLSASSSVDATPRSRSFFRLIRRICSLRLLTYCGVGARSPWRISQASWCRRFSAARKSFSSCVSARNQRRSRRRLSNGQLRSRKKMRSVASRESWPASTGVSFRRRAYFRQAWATERRRAWRGVSSSVDCELLSTERAG